ncbi:MAG: helix-turn-helix domain-containing protein, partial [Deltaproteobacteria bacterium]|nr:helix-turn-helix domain-containing protein [Deltaproteobacteria bacterium]MBW2537063.1 helix-turn-helix domain-containing protein [Deltaproteobacteria bacterium]
PAAGLPAPGAATAVRPGATPERDEVIELLRVHRGSIAEVARATERSRKQIYRWLERYQIDISTFRE